MDGYLLLVSAQITARDRAIRDRIGQQLRATFNDLEPMPESWHMMLNKLDESDTEQPQ
jgi:hypothetical protein